MTPRSTHIRSRLATHSRYRPDDTQTADELRRDYRAARLEEYIAATLATAPELTQEQRQRLAQLLQAPASSGDCAISDRAAHKGTSRNKRSVAAKPLPLAADCHRTGGSSAPVGGDVR